LAGWNEDWALSLLAVSLTDELQACRGACFLERSADTERCITRKAQLIDWEDRSHSIADVQSCSGISARLGLRYLASLTVKRLTFPT